MSKVIPIRTTDFDSPDCEAPVKSRIGTSFYFSGGSQWLLTKALTPLLYQQGEPPFEARQAFECTCINDPKDVFGGIKEAILKLKYQYVVVSVDPTSPLLTRRRIKGTARSVEFYSKYAEECRNAVTEECGLEAQEQRLHALAYAERWLLYEATHPVEFAHRYTLEELIALDRFARKQTAHMPHLLDREAFCLTGDDDSQAMVGGFMIGILMTKLPGKQITYEMFWYEKNKEGRDEIRDAFKVALLELWACRINPHEGALRNIMWDENEKKW